MDCPVGIRRQLGRRDMGREHNTPHPSIGKCPEHSQGLLHGLGPVVDGGDKVAVDVNHGRRPAPCSPEIAQPPGLQLGGGFAGIGHERIRRQEGQSVVTGGVSTEFPDCDPGEAPEDICRVPRVVVMSEYPLQSHSQSVRNGPKSLREPRLRGCQEHVLPL